jgi:thioredoxin reductase (NADPH)
MGEHHRSKVLILGSGPAGYTAAIYTSRADLKPMLVQGMETGGQLSITTDVENYPGFAEVIQGPWLMEQMRQQAQRSGAQLIADTIVKVDLSRRPFTATGDSGDIYTADAMIISTGATARWLGLKSEEKFRGFGVSACATCDGFFFRDKKVAVIGGGNTAVEEAIFLTRHASQVILIHRRDSLRAEKVLQDRLLRNPKVKTVWNHAVEEVLGDDNPPTVTGMRIRNVKSNEITELAIDGVFVAIGHTPATELFKGQLDMAGAGYILTKPGGTQTSVPGVFAAGDVQDQIYRQAVTAAGSGCMSAMDTEKFLAEAEDAAN